MTAYGAMVAAEIAKANWSASGRHPPYYRPARTDLCNGIGGSNTNRSPRQPSKESCRTRKSIECTAVKIGLTPALTDEEPVCHYADRLLQRHQAEPHEDGYYAGPRPAKHGRHQTIGGCDRKDDTRL